MKQFLLIIMCLVALFGCDDTLRRFDPPHLRFVKDDTTYMEVFDSIKNVLKTQALNKTYTFSLQGFDVGVGLAGIEYTLESGVGILRLNDDTEITKIISGYDELENIYFHFTPLETTGKYRLVFRPFNKYEMYGSPIALTLIAFDNLLPVAQLTSAPAPEYGPYAVLMDASKSYDRDERFGGTILTYDYTIVENNVTHEERNYGPKPHFVFGQAGTYSITLVVYDNDQGASAPVTVQVTVP